MRRLSSVAVLSGILCCRFFFLYCSRYLIRCRFLSLVLCGLVSCEFLCPCVRLFGRWVFISGGGC